MTEDQRSAQLRQIRDAVWQLKESPLYQERLRNHVYPVIGEGNHYAEIMFIGEAPGRTEAATGRPFCGPAGQVLEELLQSINLKRSQVYITNIVKDRPPFNRDPFPEEIAIYGPFLDQQLEIIQPRLIVTLGRYAMNYILKKFHLEDQLKPISLIHGHAFTAAASYGPVTIIPLYHPAVAVYDNSQKEILLKDFQLLKKVVDSPAAPNF